jgi:hypothetical protein
MMDGSMPLERYVRLMHEVLGGAISPAEFETAHIHLRRELGRAASSSAVRRTAFLMTSFGDVDAFTTLGRGSPRNSMTRGSCAPSGTASLDWTR